MANQLELRNLLKQNDGVLTRSQLTEHNFSGRQIKLYLKKGLLCLSYRGIYTSPDTLDDPFYVAQLRYPKGIISLETALYLYGFSDRVPERIDLTFPHGTTFNEENNVDIKAHFQVDKLQQIGIKKIKTLNGHVVKAYSLDRTMVEILRNINHVEPEIVNQAFLQYAQSSQRNTRYFLKYAKKFNISKKAEIRLGALL